MYCSLPSCSHCTTSAMLIHKVFMFPSIESLAFGSICRTCKEAGIDAAGQYTAQLCMPQLGLATLGGTLAFSKSENDSFAVHYIWPALSCTLLCSTCLAPLQGYLMYVYWYKELLYAEDARWNSKARGHQCAPHGRPLNGQVPVPQICSQDCKPPALHLRCSCVLFYVLDHARKYFVHARFAVCFCFTLITQVYPVIMLHISKRNKHIIYSFQVVS